MISAIYKHLIRPQLFEMDAEKAHDRACDLIKRVQQWDAVREITGLFADNKKEADAVEWQNLRFPGPVGLAAGFDKNATLIPLLQNSSFGFLEIGSITARAASGNPKPRMFRLPDDQAVINRMGLNNAGSEAIVERIQQLRNDPGLKVPLGVNIAKSPTGNLSGDDAIQDYATSFRLAAPVADYITINISCPNTGDGKSFEDPEPLKKLLKTISGLREFNSVPVLVKISNDITSENLSEIVSISADFGISGFVATNTSTSRDKLKTPWLKLKQMGDGGLSGAPIRDKATELVKGIRELAGPDKLIIGVGGISSGDNAVERLEAGADLVQVYTGLIYEGPMFPAQINARIRDEAFSEGFGSVDLWRKNLRK